MGWISLLKLTPEAGDGEGLVGIPVEVEAGDGDGLVGTPVDVEVGDEVGLVVIPEVVQAILAANIPMMKNISDITREFSQLREIIIKPLSILLLLGCL